MSDLIWKIANDPENCAATHILVEERKHEDEIDEVFTCFTCLEDGIRKAEQERIIKLLEEQPRVLHDGLINANHLIALIKGRESKG